MTQHTRRRPERRRRTLTIDLAPTEDPRPDGLRRASRSVVVVNTGNGKGKSSAAFGMMVRGVARGWNVAVVQFIKSGDWKVGEEKIGRQLGVDWHAFGDGFTWDSDDLTADRAHAAAGWQQAVEHHRRRRTPARDPRRADLPVSFNWLAVGDVVGGDRRPAAPRQHHHHRTRRRRRRSSRSPTPSPRCVEVKHAYQQGIRAMRGIDY